MFVECCGRMLLLMLSVALTASLIVDAAEPMTLTYSVVEEQPVGTEVGNLILDSDLIAATVTRSVSKQIYFSVLPGEHNEYFAVDAGSGELSIARQIDRDDVCYDESTSVCRLTLDVALLRPASLFRAFQIHVDVLDLNDNDPVFNVEDYVLTIPESVSPGTFYILPEAYDVDAEPYTVARYQLVDDVAMTSLDDVTPAADDNYGLPFRLEPVRRHGSSFDLRLIVTQQLDRESVERYSCHLLAFDGGDPPRSASLRVVIVVGDVNDNSPRFDAGDLFTVSVPEDFSLGVPFLQVTATDVDRGMNGQVHYAIVPHGGRRNVGTDNPLTVDPITGQLSLQRSLDYERHHTHVAIVAAHDSGPASVTAYARVVVHVTDVNDNAPRIQVHATGNTVDDVIGGERDCDAEVGENQPTGTIVAQVTVVDVDSGDNRRTTCRLEAANNRSSTTAFAFQRVHAAMMMVSTAAMLDRERADVYRLTVVCVDGGQPALKTRLPLTVCVSDSNDNSPEFEAAHYAISIGEDTAVGTVVLRVTARDNDLRQNGEVHYQIQRSNNEGDVDNLFAIDSHDGSITTAGALDFENQPQLHFVIVATDRSHPPLSTVVPVKVLVLDVNDERPQFTKPEYEFATYENEPIGTEVGVVSATDADSPPYDRFRLYVLNVAESAGTDDLFSVDMRTGRLVTLAPLDREVCAVHRLTIVARDDHPPHFTSTSNVTVRVLDRNDNAPLVAVAGAPSVVSVLSFNVSAQASPGHLLGIIRAADADSGTNAQLRWSVAGGDDRHLLVLDEHTGRLSVGRQTDMSLIDIDRFKLSVIVSDAGLPPKATVVEVHIQVLNRTSSVELLRWTRQLHLSTKATVIIVSTLLIGLLVLFVLLLVACCIRRSKVMRRSRRGRRSTDVVCPSPRLLATPEAGTLLVRGRKPAMLPTDGTNSEWSTAYNYARATPGDDLSKTQSPTPQLERMPTVPMFGGKDDSLSTYVTFQDDAAGLYSIEAYEVGSETSIWRRADTHDEAEVTRLLELLRHDNCDDSVICDCSLPVGDSDTSESPTAVSRGAVQHSQPSVALCPTGPSSSVRDCVDQPSTPGGRSPPRSFVDRQYNSDRCRTFKQPDVQVRLASPRRSDGAVTAVVSTPNVVTEQPHYSVV